MMKVGKHNGTQAAKPAARDGGRENGGKPRKKRRTPEQVAKWSKKYRETHRDEINRRQREWAAANRDKVKEHYDRYYAANRDEINRRQRERWAANRDEINQRRRERPNACRSMPPAMAQLSGLCRKLEMTDTCSKYAADLLREAVSSGFMVGRPLPHCTAAAVLVTCRKHDLPKTVNDVVTASGVEKRSLTKTYRKLCNFVGASLPVPDPAAHITKIGVAAGISEETVAAAQDILASLDEDSKASKTPVGLAAGVLYLSCIRRGELVMRRQIAEAAGVAETTITNRYQALAGPAA